MTNVKIIRIMVPNGEYYLGDPGYVFEEKEWQEICDQGNGPIYEARGKKLIMVSVGGDGACIDATGNSYDVDSGSLGLVPIDLVSDRKEAGARGKILCFKGPTLFKYIDQEFLAVGNIVFSFEESELDYDYVSSAEGDYFEVWPS